MGLGLFVAVAFQHRADVVLLIFGRHAVAGGECIVHEVVGRETAVQLIGGVLLHLSTRNHDHQRAADTRLTARDSSSITADVARRRGGNRHVAGIGRDVVAGSDDGAGGVVENADERGDRHAGGAAARGGHDDADQLVVVLRADRESGRVNRNARPGHGDGLLLGEDQIHRAGDARRAGRADARRVGGDEFLGIGAHRDRAVRIDGRGIRDLRLGRALKVSQDRDGGDGRGAADGDRNRDVHHRGIALGLHKHIAAGDDAAAEFCEQVVFKHQSARADRDARVAAACEAERKQIHFVIGDRLRGHIAGREDQTEIANGGFHLLVIHHDDDGSAYSRAGRCRYRPGKVNYV